ncbi:MAG TPA: alcohol dehydrogenase catalytic domain-containing protein [Candidatus Acidoferrum sp.]
MKAAVQKAPQAELGFEDRKRPTPGPGEVLIRVRSCGVCHGDLLLQQGGFPFARFPVVPGHEIAGEIEELGDGVSWLKPGTRVGLSALYSTCGQCKRCIAGDEILCARGWEFTGITKDGGYQEFMIASAAYVAPLPHALDFSEAAPLMCAGLTVYSGLRHAGFVPGQKVAVIGLGGLGHLAVLYAKAMGGRVAVLSTTAEKEGEARELGAELFINTKAAIPGDALRAWDGGADIILATGSSFDSMTAAFPGLETDGTLVVLGVGPGSLSFDPFQLIMGRRRIMGSPAGSRRELRETLDFAAAHGIRPRITRLPLRKAGDALEQMHRGALRGRAVLMMD